MVTRREFLWQSGGGLGGIASPHFWLRLVRIIQRVPNALSSYSWPAAPAISICSTTSPNW